MDAQDAVAVQRVAHFPRAVRALRDRRLEAAPERVVPRQRLERVDEGFPRRGFVGAQGDILEADVALVVDARAFLVRTFEPIFCRFSRRQACQGAHLQI